MAMQQNLLQQTSQTLTSWLEGFLAKVSLLLEKGKALTTLEELYFLKSQGFSETKDPDIFCLKTLKVYYLLTKEKLSRQYLGFSPKLGISLNGRFLIVKTSESPRTGKECSLSDILEKEVDPKYFLSEEMTKKLVGK